MSIAVLGSGAFGTSLAMALCGGNPVTLWGRDPEQMADIAATRINARRLPGVRLPEAIEVTDDLGRACAAEYLLLCVPMQQLDGFVTRNGDVLRGKTLVACCKGIDLVSLSGPLGRIADALPDAPSALLTGPSFAEDIARGLPTALTLAAADDGLGARLQDALGTPALRLYRTTDTIGAELGGALKNVIAIAAGIVMGAGLGESARAALITRGFAEMQRLAAGLGARPETLAGLSGLGDLILTCNSVKSRNYRFGAAIGAREPFDPGITVEGAATARAALRLARQHGVDMPITAAIVTLLDNPDRLDEIVAALLSRPLKAE